jgi:hypothetical protein
MCFGSVVILKRILNKHNVGFVFEWLHHSEIGYIVDILEILAVSIFKVK